MIIGLDPFCFILFLLPGQVCVPSHMKFDLYNMHSSYCCYSLYLSHSGHDGRLVSFLAHFAFALVRSYY